MTDRALFSERARVVGRGALVSAGSDLYFAGAAIAPPDGLPVYPIAVVGPLVDEMRRDLDPADPWVELHGDWVSGSIAVTAYRYIATSPTVESVERSWRPTVGSSWTREQTDAAMSTLIDETAPWSDLLFGFGEKKVTDHACVIDVVSVAVTDDLRHWAAGLPSGMVRFHPALELADVDK